ncbi:alpha-1,2-fucosyltransferase [uncultured Dysgonomonas sp.]|uniref:alpha-1,2-fucosyltransferase n=1 Tax=uncultured Dysgonomonas sp. TaxID=206096 RepID=UPI0026220403|nr:alpha-1,2-fucosyltransferase [uncultured Dysgonomonas sp.]
MCQQHNGIELEKVFGIKCKEPIYGAALKFLFKIGMTSKYKYLTNPIKTILRKINIRIINENFDYRFYPEYLNKSKGVSFYFGGWHCEKFFKNVISDIKKLYRFQEIPSDPINDEIIEKISTSNSVSIHIRRGDYIYDEANYNLFGSVCNISYYKNAIEKICSLVGNPVFFIFSNEMEWVKENIKIENEVFYIENNKGKDSWKDLFLMSSCKHNIISNSTFGWWGAWLNHNPNKNVICPDKFLVRDLETEIYPEDWIKICSVSH